MNVKALKNSYLDPFIRRFSAIIARKTILPATLFQKWQLERMDKDFLSFWGLSKDPVTFPIQKKFSTFTLAHPTSLWTYYLSSMEEVSSLREAYTLDPFKISASDGTVISGCYFSSTKKNSLPRRLLIFFGGNGELYKIGSCAWMFKLLQNSPMPFDIVMFDPRECGQSGGIAHSKELIDDSFEVYNYAKKRGGFSDDAIDLCGFSLGGAIATLVKARVPASKGKLINMRSFSSLDAAIKALFSPLGTSLQRILSLLALRIKEEANWSLKPISVWSEIKSPKLVLYHPLDPIVRQKASLAAKLKSSSDTTLVELKQKDSSLRISNHHVQPLSFYETPDGQDVEELIFNFLTQV